MVLQFKYHLFLHYTKEAAIIAVNRIFHDLFTQPATPLPDRDDLQGRIPSVSYYS